MAVTRIYRVSDEEEAGFLVEAASAASALRHVAAKRFRVEIAKPKDIAQMMADGAKVEDATKQEASE